MQNKTVFLLIIGLVSFLLTGWNSLAVKSFSHFSDVNTPVSIGKEKVQRTNASFGETKSPEKRAKPSVQQQSAALSVQKSVGVDANGCATTSDLTVTAGTTVYYCFTLRNSGSITLTEHTIVDTPLGINSVISSTLAPGQEIIISNDSLGDYDLAANLLSENISSNLTNNLIVSSTTITGSNAITASSLAQVDVIDTTDVIVNLFAFNTAETCGNTTQVTQGTDVYYCVSVQNIGTEVIDTHTINIASFGFNETFAYPLAQLETVQLTSKFIEDTFPGAATLGPSQIINAPGLAVLTELEYTGRRSDGSSVTAEAQNEITVLEPQNIPATATATATATITPTATLPPTVAPTARSIPTSTQFPTFTPTNTATNTPTPTNTPTITPTATLTPTMVSPLQTPPIIREAQEPPTGTNTPEPTPTFTPTFTPTPTYTITPTPVNTPIPTATPVPTETAIPTETPIPTETAVPVNSPQDNQEGSDDGSSNDDSSDDTTTEQEGEEDSAADQTESNQPPADSSAPEAEQNIGDATATVAVGIVAGELQVIGETDGNTIVYLVNQDSINQELAQLNAQGRAGAVQDARLSPESDNFLAQFPVVFGRIASALLATLGALWFMCGSLLFFAVAGLFAGLFFRQQEKNRFQLVRTAPVRAPIENAAGTVVNPTVPGVTYAGIDYSEDNDSGIEYDDDQYSTGVQYTPPYAAQSSTQSTGNAEREDIEFNKDEDDNWPASLP